MLRQLERSYKALDTHVTSLKKRHKDAVQEWENQNTLQEENLAPIDMSKDSEEKQEVKAKVSEKLLHGFGPQKRLQHHKLVYHSHPHPLLSLKATS